MDVVDLRAYRRDDDETHPALDSPAYRSTRLRAPKQPLVLLPHRLTEVTGPLLITPSAAGRPTTT